MISDADTNTGSPATDPSASPAAESSASATVHIASSPAPAVVTPARDALFLDVDGTLVPIADHPDAVRVPDGLVDLLGRLADRFGGALALISGRSIADLDALFVPLSLPIAGVHGLERRGADAVVHRCDVEGLLAPLRGPLEDFARSHSGLLLEDKGPSLALHYRRAPDCAAEAEALVRRLVGKAGAALELTTGKMVLEVKPAAADKGTAIAAFLEEAPFAGRRPVFIGDDVTDEDGFAVVNARGGLSIRVGHPDDPSRARHSLPDEQAVFDCLRRLSDGEPSRPLPSGGRDADGKVR